MLRAPGGERGREEHHIQDAERGRRPDRRTRCCQDPLRVSPPNPFSARRGELVTEPRTATPWALWTHVCGPHPHPGTCLLAAPVKNLSRPDLSGGLKPCPPYSQCPVCNLRAARVGSAVTTAVRGQSTQLHEGRAGPAPQADVSEDRQREDLQTESLGCCEWGAGSAGCRGERAVRPKRTQGRVRGFPAGVDARRRFC